MILYRRLISTIFILCLFYPLEGLSQSLPFKTTLDNGLKVVIEEDHSAPVVAVQLWVGVGSGDEEDDEAGISHVIEHMLFKGTKRRGVGEIAKEIEGVGGVINAFTSYDQTVYHITIARRFFDRALDVLSDAAMNSIFDPEELKKEIKVILQELKRGEDSPSNRLYKEITSLAFRVHPYRRPVIGYDKTLKGLTRKKVLDFYRKWYVPSNMTLVIVGDVDRKEVLKKVKEAFGGFDGRPLPPRVRAVEPPQKELRVRIITHDVKEAKLELAFHIPSLTHPDVYAIDILAAILGEGKSSRLFRKVKEEKGLVRDIATYSMTPKDPGLFFISADLDADKVEEALEAILGEVERIRKEGVEEKELQRAKIKVEADFVYERETFPGRARKWGYFETIAGDVRFEERYLEGIKGVTSEDVKRVARQYLRVKNLSIALLLPEGRGVIGVEGLKRLALRSLQEEGIKRVVLRNGITLIVKENHANPTVSVYTVFLGGLIGEGRENNGISNILARMLTRGTRSLAANEIAERIESMGGRISGFSGRNTFGLKGRFLSRFFDEGISLYTDILLHPAFPEGELKKVKGDVLKEIETEEDNLFMTTIRLLDSHLYRGHPYGMDPLGSKESVERIDRTDLLKYYRSHVKGRNMVIAVVGDVDSYEVIDRLEKAFATLPKGEAFAPELPQVKPPKGIVKAEKVRKEREQAHIALGFIAPSLKDPDRYPMEVLTEILSGMGGRLFIELRDKRGLAYVVSAFFRPGYNTGSFVVYMATSPQNLNVSIAGIRDELKKLLLGRISTEEVEEAKSSIIGRYEIGLQSNSAQASDMALNELFGLGFDEFRRYSEKIKAVTVDDVKRVAKRYIDMDSYVLSILKPSP